MFDKPCICSIKRETLQGDELQKAAARNLTHRRAHSHGKPIIQNRRSDSVVPSRPQLGHHPPLHRHNNAAHESAFPYTIPKFTASSSSVDMMQSESLPMLHGQRMGLHRASQSTSNLPQTFARVLPSNAPPDSAMQGLTSTLPTPMESEFPTPSESGFMNNSLSPANPARYSMNDFSAFSWPSYGDATGQLNIQTEWPQGEMYRQGSYATSSGQLGEWNELGSGESPHSFPSNAPLGTPQRSSVISVEQPGLSHSPSNTASDAESYAHTFDNAVHGGMPASAAAAARNWSANKEFVDPHALEMGPASYTSSTTDMGFRAGMAGSHHGGNENWQDYFAAGPASSTAESVGDSMGMKQEMDECAPMPSAGAYDEQPYDDQALDRSLDSDLATFNYGSWEGSSTATQTAAQQQQQGGYNM